MNNPTASIIMAAYNHAEYISQAISSVLSQSWQDFELIVVDDGSTDGTREAVTAFGDRVRYIYQANQGQGGARNTGISNANGQYICFLDDDDLWLPHCLETTMTILQQHPEVGALYAACQVIDSEGNRMPQIISRVIPPEQMYETLAEGGWFPPLVVTVRKTVFDDVGLLDPSLRGTDDWELWMRIASRHTFMGIDNVIALYRMHSGGLSTNVEHMLNNHLRAVDKHFGSEEGDLALWPPILRRARGGAYRLAGLAHMEAGDIVAGKSRLQQAFYYYPEFARRLDLFYELACGLQPRGSRGDFQSHNLKESEDVVLDTLRFIFDSPNISPELRGLRHIAYANAYLALGMLAYGAGHMHQSRRYLFWAVKTNPAFITDRRLMSRYVKSFLGRRLLDALNGLLRSQSGHDQEW